MGKCSYAGGSIHVHAVTAFGGSYSASYDAADNLLCRAPTSATTCASGQTATGAQLLSDDEERLTHWQNAQTSPTTQVDYL